MRLTNRFTLRVGKNGIERSESGDACACAHGMNARRRSCRALDMGFTACNYACGVDELGSRIRETKAAMSTGGLATDDSL